MANKKQHAHKKQQNQPKRTGPARLLFVLALLCFLAAGGFAYIRTTAPTPAEHAAAFVQRLERTKMVADHQQEPAFVEVSEELGLTYNHDPGMSGKKHLPEIMGPGAAFIDVDGDGLLDIFLAGGGLASPPGRGQACRLFRNTGKGFTDITEASRAGIKGHAYGTAVADFDEDGDSDIYVTRMGPNALLVNDGGVFTERAVAAGVADGGFGVSCIFFDYDRDGFLDLFVTNYIQWSPEIEAPCYDPHGTRDYCMPLFYNKPSADVLYRNKGDGSFENVTNRAGIGSELGNGLGVVASDFNDDGWPDLYVANDQTPGFLWQNTGEGGFTNEALPMGCAYNIDGVAISGMGVACEDFNGDGRFDLMVTNIRNQSHLFLENQGDYFTDSSATRGFGSWSGPATAFGVVAFDQNHDGAWDAYITNGDVAFDRASTLPPYAQTDHFLRLEDGVFVDHSAASGNQTALVGRALAKADFDNDGDIDLLITNNNGPVQLLRNQTQGEGNWLMVTAHTGKASRHAIGARIVVEAGGLTQIRVVRPQQSYLSSGDPRVHFGLGKAERISRMSITWPDGSSQEFGDLAANLHLRVVQGRDTPPETVGGGRR